MKASHSDAVQARYAGLRFAVVHGATLDDGFVQRVASLDFSDRIMGRETQAEQAISAFDTFFKAEGYKCPLPGQFASTRKKGIPPAPPLVRALLYSEMTTGVLMGVQDGAKVDGELILDLAQAGETFPGMRGEVTCRAGELVVRDGSAIVASLFQGPDSRTQVDAATTAPIFSVFGAPDLDDDLFAAAVNTVRSLFPAGSEVSDS